VTGLPLDPCAMASGEEELTDNDGSFVVAEDFGLLQPHLVDSKDEDEEQESNEEVQPERRKSSSSKWSSRTSFTANSPYFTSFSEHEVHSLGLMTDTMRDITARTKTFAQTASLMGEAAERLAASCRLQQDIEDGVINTDLKAQREKAIGAEMTSILGVVGQVSITSRSHLPTRIMSHSNSDS